MRLLRLSGRCGAKVMQSPSEIGVRLTSAKPLTTVPSAIDPVGSALNVDPGMHRINPSVVCSHQRPLPPLELRPQQGHGSSRRVPVRVAVGFVPVVLL